MKKLKFQISNFKSSPLLALLAVAIFILRVSLAQPTFSPTIDEPDYIGSAVSMIEAHKLIAPVQHPPLPRLVAAIPLMLDGARLPQCRGQKQIENDDAAYAWGTQVLYSSPKPFEVLLRHARLAMLIFPVLALLYVYLLGKELAGPVPALAAVIFFSFDPTFLGQSLFIGADTAACAGFLAAIYHTRRWLRTHSWKHAIFCAIALGLALSTKFSCLLLIPIILLLAIVEFLKTSRSMRRLLSQLAVILLAAFLILWSTYLFNIGPLSDQAGLKIPTNFASTNDPADALRRKWNSLPHWVRETPIPMPSFFLAVARLSSHNQSGNTSYLNGQVNTKGWWYYFPELLLIKSPLGFLAALLLALFVTIKTRCHAVLSPSPSTLGEGRGEGLPPLSPQSSVRLRSPQAVLSASFLLVPALVFFLAAMLGHIDIGIRHILPAIALLYLFTALQLSRAEFFWPLALIILITAAESASIHPDYLSFFNAAAGGPSTADRLALDSNLDWNQDLFRLADWLHKNATNKPYALRLSGQRNKPILRALHLDPDSLNAPPHGHLLCISKNIRLINRPLPWLAAHTPIARIGYSIDVYDLTGPASADEPDDFPLPDDPASAK